MTVTGDLRLSSGFLRNNAAFALPPPVSYLCLRHGLQDITVKNLSLTNSIYGTAAIVFLTAASPPQSVTGGLLVSSAYAAHQPRADERHLQPRQHHRHQRRHQQP